MAAAKQRQVQGEALVWQTSEYAYREKGPDWYWAVGIIAVSLAVTSVLFGNLLFAAFIILSLFTLLLYSKHKPKIVEIKIDQRGVREGKLQYPYRELESFWVEDRYGEEKLILKSLRKVLPYAIIQIEEVGAEAVRDILKKYLPEEEHHEPLSKKIMEYLGF